MINKSKIGNVEIYTVPFDHVETVSIAFLMRVGSVHESDSEAGAAHFIEHVAFRGTKSFSMKELKLTVEKVGGSLNAFTGRLSTGYYAKIPSFQTKEAYDVLYELVRYPLMKEEDVELERMIIKEEYRMSLEVPEERLHDIAVENIWPGPYGRDTIGREETIESMTVETLKEFHKNHYVSNKLKVIATGDIKHFEKLLPNLEEFDITADYEDPEEPTFKRNEDVVFHRMRDLKHVHVLLVREGVGRNSNDFVKMDILDTMLGSGMSSYLFEEIREKLGTVYDITSETLSLRKTGLFGVYFSTSPENVETTLNKVIESLGKFKVEDYFDYGIKRRLGKLMMLVESPGGLLSYIILRLSTGCDVMEFKKYEDMIKSLTIGEMKEFAERMLKGRWEIFAVGPESFEWDKVFVEV